MSMDAVIESIYESLRNDNDDIDERIKELRAVLKESGVKEVKFDPERLVQNNREGRKRMQSYFKKRGVVVKFG